MVKNPLAKAWNTRHSGSVPGSGRYPRRGNGNPLQYSCLENPMDRGAWQATVRGVAKSWTQLNVWACLNTAQQSVMGSFLLPVMIFGTYMITNPSFKFLSSCRFQLFRRACIIVLIDFTYSDIPDNFFYNASFILRFNSYPPRAFFSALRSPGLKGTIIDSFIHSIIQIFIEHLSYVIPWTKIWDRILNTIWLLVNDIIQEKKNIQEIIILCDQCKNEDLY